MGGRINFPSQIALLALLIVALFLVINYSSFASDHIQYTPDIPTASDAHLTSTGSGHGGGLKEVQIAKHLHFLYNIGDHEQKVYSQNGEDGVLQYLFANMGTKDKYYVEFGVWDGSECNTRFLWEHNGWDGLLMDGSAKAFDTRVIHNHFINESNIVSLFQKYNVPIKFDLLSVDLDSSDYWVSRAIFMGGYRPRVFIIEMNRNFDVDEAFTVSRTKLLWTEPAALFGVSPLGAAYLCNKFGYTLVYLDKQVVNGFCISRAALVDMIYAKTGFTVTEEEISHYLPPWSYVYRRVAPIAVDSLVKFKTEVQSLSEWKRIGENGEID
ncbi:hypothetical protein SeMB42_g00901 [Synchytrium endobioticum]|uniref:Methyltransferase FkbM domain-containing protein n=1 Tax=Synchytrium endobioticum TaxID=286115 RepID=A0A507DGM3_9FUNG|nr:hypothetical protein SeLEV6574_g00758 [Synchytrium endobioticum]TPX53237.1 hypothetical protein SeMB42_g00901 [Synchytrium endobioticum]